MLFFKNKEENTTPNVESKCVDCKCFKCKYMRYNACDFGYNECTPNKKRDCKINECNDYRK